MDLRSPPADPGPVDADKGSSHASGSTEQPSPARDTAPLVAAIHPHDLAQQLRAAVGGSELEIDLCPVFGLGRGHLAGLQARLRWHHHTLGAIDPHRPDLSSADDELAVALADRLLHNVVELLGAWPRRTGVLGRTPRIWIPVHRDQMATLGFAGGVLSRLADVGVEPDRLALEVDEAVLAGDAGPQLRELTALSRVGVQVAADGRGIGSGFLARLHTCPVDVLIVDAGSIADVGRSGGSAAVAAIVDLAHALDTAVMVDGITADRQLVDLRRAGCDLVAGPAVAAPVPVAELDHAFRRGVAVLDADRRGSAAMETSRRGRAARRRWWRRSAGDSTTGRGGAAPAIDTDALTGLGSRRGAHAVLREHLSAGRRPVLILIDLDGFAAFRLMRDQEAADALLCIEARRLSALVGAEGFRLRDDLFALILPDGRGGPVATQLDLTALTQGPRGMTACVGIAQTAGAETPEDLLRRARRALAMAKRRGDASVVDARAVQEPDAAVTPARARALSTLLSEGYLRVQYQPIFSLADDVVIGYEALVRPRLEHGLSGIDEAFEIAAHLGLVAELDAVCRTSILGDGPGFSMPPGAKLFISVAPEALGHRSLRTSELRRQIVNAGLERDRVVFQLRESRISDPQVFSTEARRFADQGFTIALADAGTGGGGLDTLRRTDFAILKLAPDLMAAARDDLRAAAALEALCTFAQHADIAVIATGIESPRMLSRARTLRQGASTRPRIHAVQGYHLGGPQPQPRGA